MGMKLDRETLQRGLAAADGPIIGVPSELPAGITEKAFMSEVTRLAQMLGWLCYHTLNSRGSASGFPDLVMVREKKVLAVELKVGTNKPTKDQWRWLKELDRATVEADVWRPENWPAVQKLLGRAT